MKFNKLSIGLSVLAGAAVATIGFRSGSSNAAATSAPAISSTATPIQDDLITQRTKGSHDAPITIFEVGDLQCPACKRFFDTTLPALDIEYIRTGKVKLVYINFPITQLHRNAAAAHEFVMCSALQDKFWEAHDLMYRNQDTWADMSDPAAYFLTFADSASIDRGPLTACLTNGVVRPIVEAEARMAFENGVQSTPSFVIEGGLIAGAVSIETLRPILDSIYELRIRDPSSGQQ